METATVEWDECRPSGEGPPTEGGAFSHSMQAAGGAFEPLLPCSNLDCQDGGFEILEALEWMISNRRTEKTGLLVCIGWERTKGRQTEPSPCTRAISYQIKLIYRKIDRARTQPKRTHKDKDVVRIHEA
ncbi:MAG: hypothetical protein F9K13_11455 [Candidatus Methylomirabilis oxygeniifera]|nr:MAG: hypothetical protein F9K13_11455 [Candidatus Methylomirabilis oxyfera]